MDKEIGEKIFNQVRELWVLPELKKRKAPGDFTVRQAQIIFNHDMPVQVRLNEEVKAIVEAKATRDIKKGEAVRVKDIRDISKIMLTELDPNAGHITMLMIGNRWYGSFDFHYNKGWTKEYFTAATEFLDSARANFENKRFRPFYEELFGCAELLTMTLLNQVMKKKHLKGHNERSEQLKGWAELGNVSMDYSVGMDKFRELRYSARYLDNDDYLKEEHGDNLKLIEEMYKYTKKQINDF